MKRYCIYLVFLFTLILPYQSKAMTLDEIMAPSFSVISRTQEVYLLLQGISLKEDNPLVSCNEMLAEILQNIQNETLLPDTRILFTKDMLRACLETSAFIVTRRHVDKKGLCAAAKTREDCQTIPQRSDGQRMGACTSSPAPCFRRRSEAQNRPA